MKKSKAIHSRKIDKQRKTASVVKKAILPTFCFAVLSTVAFEEAVHAAQTNPSTPGIVSEVTTKFVNVSSGSLNLRAGASTSGAVMAKLAKGTALTVYSESNGWAKVSVNGKEGYVSASYISATNPNPQTSSGSTAPAPALPSLSTKYVNVSSGSLNLRASASTSGAVMAKLAKGTALTVYSESSGWAKVSVNGKEGYVSASYLSATNPNPETSSGTPAPALAATPTPATPAPAPATPAPTTKYVNVSSGSLNMRNAASTSASIIVKLAKGTSVKVASNINGWSKIEAYGKIGYVSSSFLSDTSPSSSNNTPAAQPTVTKYIAVSEGSSLNFRKSASTGSTVLAKLTNGTEVKVSSESNGWAKVQVNGQEGYVSSQYLTTTKSTTNNTDQQITVTKFVNVTLGSSLNMRKSAATDSSIILKLGRGIEVTVYAEANGWAKITAYGQIGYVRSEYLSQTKSTAGSDSNTDTNNQGTVEKYVNVIYGSSLNLRSASASSASIITKLARGTIVTVYSEANGWAKVTANGQTGYVSSQYLTMTEPFNPSLTPGSIEIKNENYDISLSDMTNLQMAVNPQTDKKYVTYIRADALTLNSSTSGTVVGTGWNIRGGAGASFWVVGKVNNQETLQILSTTKAADGYDWYQVAYNKTWVNASPEDVAYYINPDNFKNSTVDSLQFLKLSESTNIDAGEVNDRILVGKGILQGLASTFITAGNTYGVNELYLISHALLETSNGTSQLATGVQVNGQTVYNMYGIGAYDDSAVSSGSQFAYNAGWFTPEAAIIGGAQFIANGYINAGQDTLYKMRWNPLAAVAKGYASHQYATDIGWATKQVNQINNLYSLINSYKIIQEIPQYN